ncbi:cell envelope integrity TolA C-terminal domain-containing protein [Sodalis ligni]|uniref:Colicin import membrane protein n=1 Tax=Sodalis ligni TaxID=2697027 RepID=A0A4R1N8E0_9GAMM|nr:cell envelope integrity TolA C-terminal domain-containing protein [Sodalis ligni]TCL02887.1 colicin import membrane protein [Sodalis ligni]
MRRVFPYCLLSLVFSSAFSTHATPLPSPLPSQVFAPLDDKNLQYAHDIKSAVQIKLHLEKEFNGKQCTVSFNISKKGATHGDFKTEGYKPLCAAAVKAIQDADIPAPPDNETHEIFKNSVIVFKPY